MASVGTIAFQSYKALISYGATNGVVKKGIFSTKI
jgi:hypothetical protein